MAPPKIKMRAAYFDKLRGEHSSSELVSADQLEIGVVDRDDGPDVVVSVAEFLDQRRLIEQLQSELAVKGASG